MGKHRFNCYFSSNFINGTLPTCQDSPLPAQQHSHKNVVLDDIFASNMYFIANSVQFSPKICSEVMFWRLVK
jgi:hypothetical protein